MTEEDKILKEVTGAEYKYGFTTDVESDTIPKGLNEDVIRLISKKKRRAAMVIGTPFEGLRVLEKNGRT